ERLAIGPGAAKGDAPDQDDTEALWRTYFQNIFNPARLKVKAMQGEMPKKYWRNLPEASLIPGLIEGAEKADKDMIVRTPTTPAAHHAKVRAKHWPADETVKPVDSGDARSIDALREHAKACRR